jgi:hypothetical protein
MKKKMMQVAGGLMVSAGLAHGGLLLHYEFNDASTSTTKAVDSSGNRLNGSFEQQGVGAAAALQTGSGVSGRPGDYAYDGTAAAGMGDLSIGANAGRIKYSGAGFNSSYESITICGWFKTESAPVSNSVRLLVAVGTENLFIFENVGAGLRFQIGSGYVDSGAGTYTNAGTWMFIAVTYDSTVPAGRDNLKFWIGDANGLALVKSAELTGAGAWDGLGATPDVSIGNRHGTLQGKHFNRPFDGYIDDFRIYGERSGSGGALTEQELDKVRASALGQVG